MLLNDFITVALIPALIQSNSSETQASNLRHENRRALLNSRRLQSPQSSEESDIFGNDRFFTGYNYNEPYFYPSPLRESAPPRQSTVRDPILRAIHEEEKRLNLHSGDGDDFDDMRSEEARELIHFQRRKVNMMQNFAKQAGAIVGIPPQPQGRALFFGPRNTETNTRFNSEDEDHSSSSLTTTKYPILIPNTSPVPNEGEMVESENPSTTTVRPSRGRFGIGGVFNKVTTGVGSVLGSIHNKFRGSPNTTPSPAPTPSNSVHFPEDINDKSVRPTQQPGPGTGSNALIFNDKDEASSVPLNCTGPKTEYNGKCYNVLQELPCSTGQWLIEDDTTGKGKCVENKCASVPNYAYFSGKCVLVRAEGDHCHKGMVTYIFKNGEVECDCKDQYLFNQRDGNCYPAYHRGPCNSGEMFVTKITERGARPASCIKNKCSKDGFFCNAPSCPNDRNCVELKSKCANGVWDIHPEKLAPACIDINVHRPDRIIGNVPTLACAPGSRRDILGTCRKPSKISFS